MTNQNVQVTGQKINRLITLKEAAGLVGKSELTIRRLVKSKKLTSQKEKTPTGFSYLVDEASLRSYYNPDQSNDQSVSNHTTNQKTKQTSSQSGEKADESKINQTGQKEEQANNQNNLTAFLQDENKRMRDELTSERKKREDREEELTNELGQLKSQVGYFKGITDSQKKQIEYLLTEKKIDDEEKQEEPTETTGESVKKTSMKQNKKEAKLKSILIWIFAALILVSMTVLLYFAVNGRKLW